MVDEASTAHAVDTAAGRLRNAQALGAPCPPIRTLFRPDDITSAYRVQRANLAVAAAAGRRRIGRKIGITSSAVQQQLGVDQPDFGSLLEDMAVAPGGVVESGRLLQPRVEAEVAFLLERDVDGPLETLDDVSVAVGGAAAALEIVDSRIAGWDISIVDTVADNASSGLFVVAGRRVAIADFAPATVEMTMTRNGEPVSAGTGAACLGNPLRALLWLARAASGLGDPLRAGEVVLSGALGPMVPVAAGDCFRAEITALGAVEVSFAEEETRRG